MEKELSGYHGTNQKNFKFIQKFGFKKQVSDFSFPNDLGFGAYFYLDREIENEGKSNAKKYVIKYKKHYAGKVVLIVPMLINEDRILDFNDPIAAASLEEFIQDNYDLIIRKLEEFDKKSKAYNRGNFDGIAIDLYIEHYGFDVDIVLKDTFTEFDDYRRSNFCNGREICVKNTETIDVTNVRILEYVY
ncbi:hypothetical protein ACI1UM_03965 [Lactococcus petauri]|uniref:hypothetical protein n=1 Tax=Lactococcus petauri TaxID=1940789 RepID=UPI00385361D8